MIDLETYTEQRKSAVLKFWNRTFSERPNFMVLTEELWQERIVDKSNLIEHFERAKLLLALDGDQVVGMLHFGVRQQNIAMMCYPDWKSGVQCYLALLAVHPGRRREGIGGQLWQAFQERADALGSIVLDGQHFNPFYGNSEYPFTPLWGTAEGIAVLWDDEDTITFFRARGFGPRFKALSLEANLRFLPAMKLKPLPENVRIEIRDNIRPQLDQDFTDMHEESRGEFYSVLLIESDTVRGYVIVYPLRELDKELAAIYEMNLSESVQGQGFGALMLRDCFAAARSRGLQRMQTLTVPNLSPHALGFYQKQGFHILQEWAIF